ncbi:hypothetical protein QYF61_000584, partial [Mycteria americana]
MIKGLKHLKYKEGVRVGTVQPGIERLRGNLTSVYKYWTRKCKEDGDRLFWVSSDRTRSNGHKMRKGNSLLREAVEPPSLEILKSQPDPVVVSLLWLTLLHTGALDCMISRGAFQPQLFHDSMSFKNCCTTDLCVISLND